MQKKILVGCGTLFIFFIIVLITSVAILWGQRGTAIALENQIETQYQANKSDYDKMWKTFVEMTQVTELQAEHFKDVYTDLITERHNDTGLLFKFVQESNPNLGTEIYSQLQRQIASDRATFSNNQKKILDIINQYNTFIQHDAIILAYITKREPINGDEYIITSQRTEGAFESGKDDVINLIGD